MSEKSEIMSMSQVQKAIKKEDSMTDTDKALAEAMSAGEQSVKEQNQEKKQKEQEEKMVKESKKQRDEYLKAVQSAKTTKTENPIDLRNAYNTAAGVDPKKDIERMQKQQEMKAEIKREEKLAQQKTEIEKTIQSSDSEIKDRSKPEMKNEDKIIVSPFAYSKKESPKEQGEINKALEEAKKAGLESIEADKESIPSLEELTRQATEDLKNKNTDEITHTKMEGFATAEPIENKKQVETNIAPEWQELEKKLDSAQTKEELEVLPEITELEPLPIRGIGEMIKNTPMDSNTKEWLLAHRGVLKKVNDTEGSEKQKREMLQKELTAELEEKELKLKKIWFFGKSALKKDIKRLNEIINDSTLFKIGEATIPRNSSIMNRDSGKNSGFARKV